MSHIIAAAGVAAWGGVVVLKHFIGGWALGTLVSGAYLFSKAKPGTVAFDCFLWSGVVIGPLCGLISWGFLF